MKAWILDQLTGIANMRLAEVAEPKPAPGEAVVQVHYAALNPADRYLAEGQYPANPPLPHILGRDGIGTIVAVGAGVNQFKVGDVALIIRGEVGTNQAGTFAERVAVPIDSLVEAPAGWTEPQGTAAPLVYLTAHQALLQWGALPPSVVLITGASGGVGVATLHLSKALGHTVIALSRSAEKRKTLEQLGADATFDPTVPQWAKRVKEHLGDRRVDLAIDQIGGPMLQELLETLGMWGKVSIVGRLAGPTPNFNSASLFFRRIRLGGVALSTNTEADSRKAWEEILTMMRQIAAKPLVDKVYPFEELPAAFEHLRKGPMGKVVIEVKAK
jgi:NADPH:quinone reductase